MEEEVREIGRDYAVGTLYANASHLNFIWWP